MKGKTIATFALGAATGSAGLAVVAIRGIIKSKRATKAIAKIAAEAFSDWIFEDRGDTRKDDATIKLKNPRSPYSDHANKNGVRNRDSGC